MISKRLITKLKYFAGSTHHDVDNFITMIGIESLFQNFSYSVNDKKQKIATYILENPNAQNTYGEKVSYKFLENTLPVAYHDIVENTYLSSFDLNKAKEFLFDLSFSGIKYDPRTKKIEELSNSNIDIESKDNFIQEICINYNFGTSKGHYLSAINNLNNDPAAANAQLRTFAESIFMEMAAHIKHEELTNMKIASIDPVDDTRAMQILIKANKPILHENLKEWYGNGCGFLQVFFQRLGAQGSHPGIPDDREAYYRFELVMVIITDLLERFEKEYPISNNDWLDF